MAKKQMSYKGHAITIDEDGDRATITIDGEYQAGARLHSKEFPAWMSECAYFMAPDVGRMAKHLVDNFHILTSDATMPEMRLQRVKKGAGAKPARRS